MAEEYYKVTIVKERDNPDYAEQIKAYEARTRYQNYNDPCPSSKLTVRTLEIELTQAEYDRLRRAVLEIV